MKHIRAVALTALSAALLAAHGAAKVPGLSDAGKTALTAQMNDAVKKGDAPAIVEIVVDREGVLYGGASGLPANAIVNIASMTKPVTSVAIMMLAEQGNLKIDDPVSKYLDGYDQLQVISRFNAADATYETRPAKTVMTIQHLLSHTSGIGYGWTNPIENALTAKTKMGELELPLLDDPGTIFHYSPSTRVLGFIVEKVTGSSLESWYQEHIFKPLGMVDTSVRRGRGEAVARGAAVFTRRRKDSAAAESDSAIDADRAVPRRWRSLFDRRGLWQVRTDAAEWRDVQWQTDPDRSLGKDDGPERDRLGRPRPAA